MKKDINQQWFEFDEAGANLAAALETYIQKAVAAACVPELRKQTFQRVGADCRAVDRFRKQVNQGIGVLHAQTGRSYQELFILCYHRLFKLTGVHPVVESIRSNIPVHLDVVEKHGLMGKLLEIVLEMMQDPELVLQRQ